jgi:formamidopyrimidine-DNA glycosylase
VSRRAKYLIFDFAGIKLMIHLSQGGRIDIESPARTTRSKGAVARFSFENGDAILLKEFGTERKAAIWVLAPEDPGPLEGLGPEPASEEFAELIRTSDDKRRIHTILRDQRTIAGIGRGFSDEVLHEAQLSPFSSLASLTAEQRQRLIDATRAVLDRALRKERKRTGGLPAKIEGRFAIHGHAGEPCPRCNDTLQRVSYESHEVVYCPACQTDDQP